MAQVTLNDLSLKGFTMETLPLIRDLHKRHFAAKSEICCERAKLITEYLRDQADPQDPPVVRQAKAINYFLSNKAPVFHDDNLLAGTTTSKPLGAPLYPELIALTIWPELETISSREANPQLLSRENQETLNFEVFPYWLERNILEITRKKYHNPKCLNLFERLIFFVASKAGTISHTVPDFTVVLEKGLVSIIKEANEKQRQIVPTTKENKDKLDFYQAVQIALQGIINYAANLSKRAAELAQKEKDSVRRQNLESMAAVCRQVPAQPATSFREAVNSLWICHIAILAENINMAMSPGRLDQILFPYYVKDLQAGTLTLQEALELAACLWFKLADNVNMVPKRLNNCGAGPAQPRL